MVGRRIELFIGSRKSVQTPHVEIHALQYINQKGRSARREPEVLVLLCIESIEQAERIIDVGAMLAEMITVVLPFQMSASFLVSLIVCLGHPLDVRLQVCEQFLLGDAAKRTEIIAHADVLQVIQFAEDAQLAELADAGDEEKAKILSQPFEGAEELPHLVAELLLQGGVGIAVQQGSIVLVNQHDHLLSGLLISS